MNHVAIDLGARKSQICVRDESGVISREEQWATDGLSVVFELLPKPSRVILETGAEAFAVADQARAAGHEVRIVPSSLARVLGIGERGVKTDRRDAQCLSKVSTRVELPTVHQPQTHNRRRKTLCGMRDALVSARTKLINTVRGWLRGELCRISSGAAHTFPKRVREQLSKREHELPACVERQLTAIEQLSAQISEANDELEAELHNDPICKLLATTPGIGPVTAVRYVAAIDTPARFSGAQAVCSYLGLTPGERQSGSKQHRTGICKAGDPAVRWTLTQAAWTMRRLRPDDPCVRWAQAIEKRRGKQVATIALARKLAGILYAMWRDNKPYDPSQTAAPPEDNAS